MADVPLTRRDLLTTKGDLYVRNGTDLVRLAVGTNDHVLTADSAQAAGVKWAAGGGGGGGLAAYARATRTAGNVTITATTLADTSVVDAALDLTVAAVAGDVLSVGVSALWSAASANWTAMDAITMVSGSGVNYISGHGSAGLGVMAWFAVNGDLVASSGTHPYVVQAGDLSSGNVTLRLLARTLSTGRAVRAGAGDSLTFWVINHGTP